MASSRATLTRRILRKIAPVLFKKCPAGNWHPRRDQICECRLNEYGGDPFWNGGIYRFHDQSELIPLRRAVKVDKSLPPSEWETEWLPDHWATEMPDGWRWF